MFCSTAILRLLNCITEAIQLTEDSKYFPQVPHVCQPCFMPFLGRLEPSVCRKGLQTTPELWSE